jgi:hypothetical protein
MSIETEFERLVDKFWGSRVVNIEHDLILKNVIFTLSTNHNSLFQNNNIIFMGVSSLYWNNDFNDDSPKRFDTEIWGEAHVESIFLIKPAERTKTTTKVISGANVITQCISSPNVGFEIWETVYLIEAKSVNIDGTILTLM